MITVLVSGSVRTVSACMDICASIKFVCHGEASPPQEPEADKPRTERGKSGWLRYRIEVDVLTERRRRAEKARRLSCCGVVGACAWDVVVRRTNKTEAPESGISAGDRI